MGKAIEPWDYVAANGLGYFEGSAVKYITRWREKGGVEYLRKAVHFIEKLIEVETEKAEPPLTPAEPMPQAAEPMPEPICIALHFDPYAQGEELGKIFADPFKRTFWLLWKRDHITGPHFNQAVEEIGKKWNQYTKVPTTDFKIWLHRIITPYYDICDSDASQFVEKYHRYFREFEFTPFDLVSYKLNINLPVC